MLDRLQGTVAGSGNLSAAELTARLLLALAFGGIVAAVYVLTQRRARSELVPFATTLVLLTVLIAMVTLVIGDQLARAFSLAGALAIIRFRTVVEDTRDTAFVIFAVVVGMGVGVDLILVPLIGTPLVAAAALALSFFGRPTPAVVVVEHSLSIRLGLGREPGSLLKDVFDRHLDFVRLQATSTARQGAALDLTYVVRLRRQEDAVNFVSELNRIEGVQNVELRQC